MSRFGKLGLASAFVGTAVGSYYLGAQPIGREKVEPLTSYIFADKLSDPIGPYLVAMGTWKGADIANRVNTGRIYCEGHTKRCEMNQADVYGMGGRTEYLSLNISGFHIVHQDQNMVTAVNEIDQVCTRQTLLIDRQAKKISLVRTKSNQTEMCAPVQDEPFTISLGDPRK